MAVIKKNETLKRNPALKSLTLAALALPGLIVQASYAADGDEVDFQYSHYQEGKRDISGITYNTDGSQSVTTVKSFNPIEVESIHGAAKISLADRVKFAFNYVQDTWGGATPISTAPAGFGMNTFVMGPDFKTITGASPYLVSGNAYLDDHLNPLAPSGQLDPLSSLPTFVKSNQLTHVMSYASPETRKQGDFKLTYEWDEATVSLGGGLSLEDDYESRFGNLGGLWHFNQKRTTASLDLSYTNSETNAVMDHDAGGYLSSVNYSQQGFNQISNMDNAPYTARVQGVRQDWATHVGLSHVLNPDSVISADIGYNRSTGYLSNPYNGVNIVFIDPDNQCCLDPGVAIRGSLAALMEQRPEVRNQWNLGGRLFSTLNR